MLLATLLWSTAGVVTRHLDSAPSFEVTFWRSAFNALALAVALTVIRGSRPMAQTAARSQNYLDFRDMLVCYVYHLHGGNHPDHGG